MKPKYNEIAHSLVESAFSSWIETKIEKHAAVEIVAIAGIKTLNGSLIAVGHIEREQKELGYTFFEWIVRQSFDDGKSWQTLDRFTKWREDQQYVNEREAGRIHVVGARPTCITSNALGDIVIGGYAYEETSPPRKGELSTWIIRMYRQGSWQTRVLLPLRSTIGFSIPAWVNVEPSGKIIVSGTDWDTAMDCVTKTYQSDDLGKTWECIAECE